MAFAVKTVTQVRAWELGAGSEAEKEMLRCGKIIAHPDGIYELFTEESTEGKGQMAKAGDYFKVDNRGFSCPNERLTIKSQVFEGRNPEEIFHSTAAFDKQHLSAENGRARAMEGTSNKATTALAKKECST